ncbi:MAG: DUF5939 domain-containing protein [Planctomycetota bacterium]
MDPLTLQRKLDSMKTFSVLNPENIDRFGKILETLSSLSLFRINPLYFAKTHHFSEEESLDLFIHGTKIGLFDFDWNVICPACGVIEHSYNNVNDLAQDPFYCNLCKISHSNALDDQVEVSFSINPTVQKIQFEPFLNINNYREYFYSSNYLQPPEVWAYLKAHVRSFHSLQPDSVETLSFEALPGTGYRLTSLDQHQALDLHFSEERSPVPLSIEIQVLPSGFSPAAISSPAGSVSLKVTNLNKVQMGFVLLDTHLEKIKEMCTQHPAGFVPFFTGKMLLNHQSFRNLFRIQHLSEDLKLNIRSLTLLFTDLKGSTELYDQTGDLFAYQLIQKHFSILSRMVRKHSGAIIKTMGDAIMASFSVPFDGVCAALDMMKEMEVFNEELKKHSLGLKIGLHEGSTLAVNADARLDYFGQTVNIAARVQGLAQAGEIWITDSIFQSSEVQHCLANYGYNEEKRSVSLKGVGQLATVYRCVQR